MAASSCLTHYLLIHCLSVKVSAVWLSQLETAGDCYIAAGGLFMVDADGFTCIDPAPDPAAAAQRVLSFAKVGGAS